MDPEQLDLIRRCGEIAGVLREETGLRVEMKPALLGQMWDGWKVRIGDDRTQRSFWFHEDEIQQTEPRESVYWIICQLQDGGWHYVNAKLRPPAREDSQDQENRQHDDDNGVGALTGHVHGEHSYAGYEYKPMGA
jgi:hypothetical protein